MPGRFLLLLLLLAAFAVPGTAAVPSCHDAPRTASAHAAMHGPAADPAPEKAWSPHVCVGCVPIADWLGDRITQRILPDAREPEAVATRLDLGGLIAPALPPPRRA